MTTAQVERCPKEYEVYASSVVPGFDYDIEEVASALHGVIQLVNRLTFVEDIDIPAAALDPVVGQLRRIESELLEIVYPGFKESFVSDND